MAVVARPQLELAGGRRELATGEVVLTTVQVIDTVETGVTRLASDRIERASALDAPKRTQTITFIDAGLPDIESRDAGTPLSARRRVER